MRLLRTVDIKLKNIRMPGDWQAHLDMPKVEAMAATIRASAAIHGNDEAFAHSGLPAVILDQSHRLWAGRNRYEATRTAGLDTIRANIYEFADPAEAEITELCENLHRKRLDGEAEAKATARLVELVTKRVEKARATGGGEFATELQDPPEEKPGPKKSARGEAIERVAKATGISRQGVEKRLNKAERKDEPAPPVSTIETWGIEVAPEVLADAKAAQDALDEIDRGLRRGQAALTELIGAGKHPRFSLTPALMNLREDLHQAARVARALRPAAFCAWCKGIVKDCPTCSGKLLIGDQAVEQLPADLKKSGWDAMVCIGPGQAMPYVEAVGRVFGKEPKAKGKKASKKLRVQDEEGNALAVEPDPLVISDSDIPF